MKEVWVRSTADATEVQSRIREEWKWNSKQQIQYKYMRRERVCGQPSLEMSKTQMVGTVSQLRL